MALSMAAYRRYVSIWACGRERNRRRRPRYSASFFSSGRCSSNSSRLGIAPTVCSEEVSSFQGMLGAWAGAMLRRNAAVLRFWPNPKRRAESSEHRVVAGPPSRSRLTRSVVASQWKRTSMSPSMTESMRWAVTSWPSIFTPNILSTACRKGGGNEARGVAAKRGKRRRNVACVTMLENITIDRQNGGFTWCSE